MKLENRIECPFCNNKKFNLLYRKRFDSEEVKKFLTNYYLNNSKIYKILGSNFGVGLNILMSNLIITK